MFEINAVFDTGQALKASLFLNGVQTNSGITMTEIGTSGFYVGDAPAALASGLYTVVVYQATDAVATGTLAWDGAKEIKPDLQTNEIHLIHGLQAGAPLTVNATARTAGAVTQTVNSAAGTTQVERV